VVKLIDASVKGFRSNCTFDFPKELSPQHKRFLSCDHLLLLDILLEKHRSEIGLRLLPNYQIGKCWIIRAKVKDSGQTSVKAFGDIKNPDMVLGRGLSRIVLLDWAIPTVTVSYHAVCCIERVVEGFMHYVFYFKKINEAQNKFSKFVFSNTYGRNFGGSINPTNSVGYNLTDKLNLVGIYFGRKANNEFIRGEKKWS